MGLFPYTFESEKPHHIKNIFVMGLDKRSLHNSHREQSVPDMTACAIQKKRSSLESSKVLQTDHDKIEPDRAYGSNRIWDLKRIISSFEGPQPKSLFIIMIFCTNLLNVLNKTGTKLPFLSAVFKSNSPDRQHPCLPTDPSYHAEFSRVRTRND